MDIRNSISSYDYQGNIVGVYNARKNSFEQFTDYYPYGMPHASISSEAAGAEVNRRKFGGKELMSHHGLNLYDFVARLHNPAFPHFTTPDPLAEKFKHLSPHLFCAGDPINLIVPTGMKWLNADVKDRLLEILNNRLNALNKEIEETTNKRKDNVAKNKPTAKLDKKLENLNKQIDHINQAILDIGTLEEDAVNTYDLMQTDGDAAHRVQKISGIIYIQYSSDALIFHEATHIRQSLESKNGVSFSEENYLLYSSSDYARQSKNEIEASQIQYSVYNHSLPIHIGNITQIDVEYLTRIWTQDNRPAYKFAHDYLKYQKTTHKNNNE